MLQVYKTDIRDVKCFIYIYVQAKNMLVANLPATLGAFGDIYSCWKSCEM